MNQEGIAIRQFIAVGGQSVIFKETINCEERVVKCFRNRSTGLREVCLHRDLLQPLNACSLYPPFVIAYPLKSRLDSELISLEMKTADCDVQQFWNQINSSQLEEAYVKTIFIQMLCSVGVLHTNLISHGDLKPSNFLLDFVGEQYFPKVSLTDFGGAQLHCCHEVHINKPICYSKGFFKEELLIQNTFSKEAGQLDQQKKYSNQVLIVNQKPTHQYCEEKKQQKQDQPQQSPSETGFSPFEADVFALGKVLLKLTSKLCESSTSPQLRLLLEQLLMTNQISKIEDFIHSEWISGNQLTLDFLKSCAVQNTRPQLNTSHTTSLYQQQQYHNSPTSYPQSSPSFSFSQY